MTLHEFYRSPKTLSIFANVGLAIVAFFNALTIVFSIIQLVQPNSTVTLSGRIFKTWFLAISLVSTIKLLAFIFTIVFFLIWLNRAYKNLPALRAENTEFTPGWAVGWWFIPFANLVKPYQVMRELWNESEPEAAENLNFISGNFGAPRVIKLWWAFWIATNIITNVLSRIINFNDPNSLTAASYFFMLTSLLSLITGLLAIKIVMEITKRQEERFANIEKSGSFQMPPDPPKFY